MKNNDLSVLKVVLNENGIKDQRPYLIYFTWLTIVVSFIGFEISGVLQGSTMMMGYEIAYVGKWFSFFVFSAGFCVLLTMRFRPNSCDAAKLALGSLVILIPPLVSLGLLLSPCVCIFILYIYNSTYSIIIGLILALTVTPMATRDFMVLFRIKHLWPTRILLFAVQAFTVVLSSQFSLQLQGMHWC